MGLKKGLNKTIKKKPKFKYYNLKENGDNKTNKKQNGLREELFKPD